MNVKIICDSSCNVPDAYLNSLDILQVPAWINFADGSSLRNQVDITTAEFYTRLAHEKHLPTTSQPTPQDFIDAIESVDAAQIVVATVSSKMSGTHNSAVQAQSLLPDRNIHLYDTLSASMGGGWQIIVGAEAAAQGADAAGVLAAMEASRDRVHTILTIDTLKYLAASGRAPMLQAMLGNLLNIKPMLAVQQGTLELVDRARGRKRSKRALVEKMQAAVGSRPLRVALINANIPDEAAEYAAEIRQALNVQELIIEELGPVLGTLAGPGALAIAALIAD
ncbi:MAG: DegV family protein [Caldilineales bacterium]|nr:DegV family protein [Caldilineales bacterium]